MPPEDSTRNRLPRGVSALPRARNGRGFRASIRRGKGVEVHLGIYRTSWRAAFAYGVAAQLLGRHHNAYEIPRAEQPDADEVQAITDLVRGRLGMERKARPSGEVAPGTEDLLTLFEVTVVGFWRDQAAADTGDSPSAGLDVAAGRLVEAAHLLFWSRSAGHPTPIEAMTRLLARRLDQSFRRSNLTREVLDDDGDDPREVARWLVRPDAFSGARIRGFREEIRHLYPDLFEGAGLSNPGAAPSWSEVLGLAPPFNLEQIRGAYRARSRSVHPDAGGSEEEFVRLRSAYEAALAHCVSGSFR
ncbi:MAG: hypothetical protein NVSMB9_19580 [Isosphaeraceae bacterium]